MPDVTKLRWRIGRRNDYTIYAMVGTEPSEDDIYIGSLNTPELSAAAVNAHNCCWAALHYGS